MPTYIVSYDISDEKRLQALKTKLKQYGTYCPINRYCWAIVTDKTHSEIRDDLKTVLTGQDRLFVVRSGTAGAWYNPFGEENSVWLKKYL